MYKYSSLTLPRLPRAPATPVFLCGYCVTSFQFRMQFIHSCPELCGSPYSCVRSFSNSPKIPPNIMFPGMPTHQFALLLPFAFFFSLTFNFLFTLTETHQSCEVFCFAYGTIIPHQASPEHCSWELPVSFTDLCPMPGSAPGTQLGLDTYMVSTRL